MVRGRKVEIGRGELRNRGGARHLDEVTHRQKQRGLARFSHDLQRGLSLRLGCGGSQVEYAYIFAVGALGIGLLQLVIGTAEGRGRKEFLAGAGMGKGTRLTDKGAGQMMRINAMPMTADLAGKFKDVAGPQISLDHLRAQPDTQFHADEPGGNRRDVPADHDRREARGGHLDLSTGCKGGSRKGAECLLFHQEGRGAARVLMALVDEVLQKMLVVRAAGKIARPPDPQSLVKGVLECVVGLFHFPVFMGDPLVVPGGGNPVMPHEGLRASGPIFALFVWEMTDGCAQMVGAMLGGSAANLPQCPLDPLGQRLECFAETDGNHLHIRGGQHKMGEKMRKRNPSQSEVEVLHVGKIGLTSFSWHMDLLTNDVFAGSMPRLPACDMSA